MNFTAFDFETAKGKYACSLGLAKFRDGKVFDSRHFLINPNIDDWNPVAMRIHGIRPEQVMNSPIFNELSDEIFDFIGDDSLVAHNCSFDYSVLDFCSDISIKELSNDFYCTLNYSRLVIESESYRLDKLVDLCNLSRFNHHNALDDAIASGELFVYLLNKDSSKYVESKYELNKTQSRGGFYVKGITIFDSENIIKLNEQEKNALLDRSSISLTDLSFVPSGVFVNFSRNEINSIIENNSGIKRNGISKNLNYVIAGQKMGPAKYKKAEELNISIISEQEFLEMI